MKMPIRLALSLLSGCILLSQCGILGPTSGGMEIEFELQDDSSNIHLKLGEDDRVTGYARALYEYSVQLTAAQADSIRGRVFPISFLSKHDFIGGGFDGTWFTFHLQGRTWRLYMYDFSSAERSEQAVWASATQTMQDLAAHTYAKGASWLGLEFEAAPDKAQYVAGETIEVVYRVLNPTTKIRTLPFRNDGPLSLSVSGDNCSGSCLVLPYEFLEDPRDEVRIVIQPGGSWEQTYRWEQPYVDSDGILTTLGPGTYTLRMNLTNWLFYPKYDTITVVQP